MQKLEQFKTLLDMLKISISNPLVTELILKMAIKINNGEELIKFEVLEAYKMIQSERIDKPIKEMETALESFKLGHMTKEEAIELIASKFMGN